MPVRPMLLHRMGLISFRLFCKNLGYLQEFFGQMVYRPPLAENCPYAYVSMNVEVLPIGENIPQARKMFREVFNRKEAILGS